MNHIFLRKTETALANAEIGCLETRTQGVIHAHPLLGVLGKLKELADLLRHDGNVHQKLFV